VVTLARRDTTTGSTANQATYASASFTPTVDDLLVVFVLASATAVATPPLTASANGLTFTLVDLQTSALSATLARYTYVADQLVPSSPSAMTVTVDFTGDNATGCHIVVMAAIGMSRVGLDAVRQWVGPDDNHTAGNTPTVTFAAACLTTNPVLVHAANLTNSSTTVTQPSGWTEFFDGGYATPATGCEVAGIASGFTSATVTAGSTMSGGLYHAIELDASSPGQSAAANTATETDTAPALGRTKTRATTATTETDTAPALTRVKTHALSLSTETDIAQAVTQPPAGFTPAAETDTAPAFGRSHTRAIGAAVETDTGITLAARKTRSLAAALETDTAVAHTRVKTRNVAVAIETDTALLVGRAKTRPVGTTTETDTAPTIGIQSGSTLGVATETDAATLLGRRKTRTLGIPVDTQTSILIGRIKIRALGPATDLGQAITLGRVYSRLLAPAAESSQALTLMHLKRLNVSVALELDTAVALFTALVGKPVNDPRLTFTVVQAALVLDTPTTGILVLTTTRPALDLTGAHP